MTVTGLVATSTPATAADDASQAVSCTSYSLPVRLSDSGEATETMWGELS